MLESRQSLSQHIGKVLVARYIRDRDRAVGNLIPNIVMVNIDVLRLGMELEILGEANCSLSVTVDRSRNREGMT